ncbi:hypothetical protein CASFOL_016846 [Castilleja foliolosa]|uniref:SAP domain-containing protein n=1 Tax=Castilleja foliolosa TaxID=1961234 RepID=A0ABD3DAN3_9LAMI
MCFHHMERKKLQALCKKHKIPANLSNLEMANRLKEYFKEKEKSSIQGSIHGLDDEIEGGTESTNVVIDFHSMKRRELQALCLKHSITANLPNLEMAKRLTEFFKEKEKSPFQGPIDVFDEIEREPNSTNMVMDSMKRKDLQALCQKHNIPANSPNLEMAKRLNEFFKEKEKSPFQEPMNVFDGTEREIDSTNMVMDFDSMKRKDLQALCQKHKIPANLSNLEMAKRLNKFFKENEKPSIQGLINEQSENAEINRKVKKVRFSPEHELFEFSRSPELKRRSRRNTVSVRPSNLSVQTVDNGLTSSENVDRQGTVTRSRGLKLMEGRGNETKRGKKGVKFDEQKNNVATIKKTDNGGVTGRVLRSKGKELADGDVKNATKRGNAILEDENVLDVVDEEKSIEEIVTKKKRVSWAVGIVDNVPIVSGEDDDNRVVTRRSSKNKGVMQKNEVAEVHQAIEPHFMKRVPKKNVAAEIHRVIEPHTMKRVPEKNKTAEVHRAIDPQIMVRRSKRNANAVGDSQVLNDDINKHENGGVKGSRKSAKLLAEDDAKGETGRSVIQIEEPVKLEMNRSGRRKSVIALTEKGRNGELIAETENMRSSVPQLVIAGGLSKIGKVSQPITRRSMRKTTILEPIASVEKLDTDVAVENCEAEKLFSPRRSSRVASFCKSLENNDILGGDTITRRSKRKTTTLEPVASEEKRDTDVTVENYETKKCLSPRRSSRVASFCKSLKNKDELGVNTIIQQKNEPRKRKRSPILEGDVKTDDVWSSSKQSTEESRNKKRVSFLEPQLSGSKGAGSIGGTDTRNENVKSNMGLGEFNRKTSREERDVAIAESFETNFIEGNELLNSVENATSIIAELETDLAESEKQISASNIKAARKVDTFEFDVQAIVEQDITSEVQLFSPIEDSSHVDTIENQILEEGSNVSGNEGFAEPSSVADSVLPADLVDYVGEVEGVSVKENPNSIEIGDANVLSSAIACHHNVLDYIEASNDIYLDNNEDTREVGAPGSCADLEVTEAEADTDTQPCSCVADHAGEVEAISVQNVDHLEASNSNLGTNKEDGASEAGEIGTPESRADEICIDYTHSKSALQLKETPSGKLRSIEGDNVEIEKGGCLKEHKIASDGDDEFGVADLFAGERSVGISSQDRGIVSGEYSARNSDEPLMDKEYLAISPKTASPDMANICPETDLEAELTGKGEEICIDKSLHSEVAKTVGDGSPDCQENQEFVMSNILDLERRDEIVQQDGETLSCENSVGGFDEEGMDIKLKSGCEAYQISEGDEAENNDNHENRKDDDWGLSVSNLFDGEKSDWVTSQDRGFFSAEESNKGFYEQVVFDIIPVVSTMCGEVETGAVSSSLKEISPSKPCNSSKSPGTGPIISDAGEIIGNESSGDTITEKEVAIIQNNMNDGDREIFNQADEHANEDTPIQAEQPKSPLAIYSAISNTLGASESKTTALAMCKEITTPVVEGSNANEDGNDGSCGKDENKLADACITDVDMSMDRTVSKSGAESLCELEFHHPEDTVYNQSSNLHEKHTLTDVTEQPDDLEPSQSLREIELSNLLEATVTDVTSTGLNDTMINSDVNSNLLEGERGDESAKTTYVNDLLPTYKEEPDSGPSVGREDYQLRLLFATPIKIDSPSKVDKTSTHENESNRADKPFTKCDDIAVENSVAQIKSDEKMRDVENELKNCLCPSSDSSEKPNFVGSNEVDSVESMNTSGLGLSEALEKHLTENTCDEEGVKKCDLLTEENKDERIIFLGESCLFEEATDNECGLTEENTISSFGSSRQLDKVEGCQDILMDTDLPENLSCGNRVCPKSEKKMSLSSGAECEISDAYIQKSNVLENNHHLTCCYEENNVNETLIDTLEGPKAPMDAGADIGSFNSEKDVTGTSSSLFPNDDDAGVTEREDETGDDIDPYEAKKWDEKDDDSRPLPDISDEPRCNSEVAILEGPSAGNTLELQSTYKGTSPTAQNVDNVLSAAEQGFSVCGAEFDEFSNLAMHILPGDTENGDNEKPEEGTPVYNSEDDHEKESGVVEINSTATNVQCSIPELHLEQNVLDSNNDVHSVSDEVTANENCYDEKSDAGTPLLNLEGDDEKYDEGVEEKILGNEILKETEVADTVKEYNDSELAFMKEVAVCEDGTESEKLEETISINLHALGYTAEKSSFKESVTENSGSAGNDAILLQKEGIESEEGGPISSSSIQLSSSVMENARTILIHGTPSKVVKLTDMNENGPAYKSSNIGDVTAVRPAKRKALQDVEWE